MVKNRYKILMLSLFVTVIQAGDKYILNEVLAVITGSKTGTALILTQDIRPSLDGRQRTLRDLVLEELMIVDAANLNMTVTDEDTEKTIKQLQKTYTKQQIEESLRAMGLTMDDMKVQLKRQEIISRLFDYRVRNDKRLMITRSDVEREWTEHAPLQEATVTLSEATIKTTLSEKQLKDALEHNTYDRPITWRDSFTLKASDLAEDKRFVLDKHVGDIIFMSPVLDGFDVTKLVAKTSEKLLPLITGEKAEDDKRIAQVEDKLRIERFNEVRQKYEQSLLDKAHIKFTYESDRRAVMGQ